jgi:hypothetical protein
MDEATKPEFDQLMEKVAKAADACDADLYASAALKIAQRRAIMMDTFGNDEDEPVKPPPKDTWKSN